MGRLGGRERGRGWKGFEAYRTHTCQGGAVEFWGPSVGAVVGIDDRSGPEPGQSLIYRHIYTHR